MMTMTMTMTTTTMMMLFAFDLIRDYNSFYLVFSVHYVYDLQNANIRVTRQSLTGW